MNDLNRYHAKVKLTYEYDIIATSPEQAERIARDRFGWNFTVDDVDVEFKDIEWE